VFILSFIAQALSGGHQMEKLKRSHSRAFPDFEGDLQAVTCVPIALNIFTRFRSDSLSFLQSSAIMESPHLCQARSSPQLPGGQERKAGEAQIYSF
jgi:hypothetical protein